MDRDYCHHGDVEQRRPEGKLCELFRVPQDNSITFYIGIPILYLCQKIVFIYYFVPKIQYSTSLRSTCLVHLHDNDYILEFLQ